jgi:hypothetical protein
MRRLDKLKSRLKPFGFDDKLILVSMKGDPLPDDLIGETQGYDLISRADLLVNMLYGTHPNIVNLFHRTALIDIDPGLLQLWMSEGKIDVAEHDFYFTIGETVGTSEAKFPDAGLDWIYTPPCVSLEWWPVKNGKGDAPYSTVTHWTMGEWMTDGDEVYANDKKEGFKPFLALPNYVSEPLELALRIAPDEVSERERLESLGWQIRDSWEIASTPWEYQEYIQGSRGEFSCVKPSCLRLQNAWVSDRTICYLASGKPVVVQNTGPSEILPDAEGMFRFESLDDAAEAIQEIESNYDHQCKRAREFAEQHFDAKRVVSKILEISL